MRKEKLVLYNRIRNLKILYQYVINNRTVEYLSNMYKIKATSINVILARQIVDYNFYILSKNKLLNYNVQTIYKDETLNMDEEYQLIKYVQERISAIHGLVLIREEGLK